MSQLDDIAQQPRTTTTTLSEEPITMESTNDEKKIEKLPLTEEEKQALEEKKKRKRMEANKKRKKKKVEKFKKKSVPTVFQVLNVHLMDSTKIHSITKEDIKQCFPDCVQMSRPCENIFRIQFSKEQDCLKYFKKEEKKKKKQLRKRDLEKKAESTKDDEKMEESKNESETIKEESTKESTKESTEESTEESTKSNVNKDTVESREERILAYRVQEVINGFKFTLRPEKAKFITKPEWKEFSKQKKKDPTVLIFLLPKETDISHEKFMELFPDCTKAIRNNRDICALFPSEKHVDNYINQSKHRKLEKGGIPFVLRVGPENLNLKPCNWNPEERFLRDQDKEKQALKEKKEAKKQKKKEKEEKKKQEDETMVDKENKKEERKKIKSKKQKVIVDE